MGGTGHLSKGTEEREEKVRICSQSCVALAQDLRRDSLIDPDEIGEILNSEVLQSSDSNLIEDRQCKQPRESGYMAKSRSFPSSFLQWFCIEFL